MASLTDDLQQLLPAIHRRSSTPLPTEQAVRKVYADFGGANGAIRGKQKELLKAAPNAEKKAIGQATNEVLQTVDAAFAARSGGSPARRRRADLRAHRRRDLARARAAARPPASDHAGAARDRGDLRADRLHRRRRAAGRDRLPQLRSAGDAEGPSCARHAGHLLRRRARTDVVLRTHTSPVQIRTMLAQKPPVRIIVAGHGLSPRRRCRRTRRCSTRSRGSASTRASPSPT